MSWALFCRETNEPPGMIRTFSETMRKRGFQPSNTVPAQNGSSRRVRGFVGVELRPQPQRHYEQD
ncbi:hypothetical protein [Microvirga sp. VF16]|uniref:hypothetical protein n=1 Tax=Microvirga sp. VF16 TaxID=2807101 RepID=UPI00193DBF15|nr:hypothetical protein [Microvirga sp. VF16]QRM32208.1 hypothetical protein JO965_29145 [Microvirga sp. VF16]